MTALEDVATHAEFAWLLVEGQGCVLHEIKPEEEGAQHACDACTSLHSAVWMASDVSDDQEC